MIKVLHTGACKNCSHFSSGREVYNCFSLKELDYDWALNIAQHF